MTDIQSDADLADTLERAVKLLRVGSEGRGTYAWYQMTEIALRSALKALQDVVADEEA
jgi:hypothetical protein